MVVLGSWAAYAAGALSPENALAAECATSGPPSGAYSATICFSAPVAGATLTGPVPVTVTAAVTGTSPGIQRAVFRVDGADLLTDFTSPYTFSLPTHKYADGPRTLQARFLMRDGFETADADVAVTYVNGNATPPVNTNSRGPVPGTTPAPGRPFVFAAAGDGAGGEPSAAAVTDIVAAFPANLFAYLGDVYERGTTAEFYNWYAPSTYFGRFRAITNPVSGDHEYHADPTAAAYADYWDNMPPYYGYDAAGWHVVALNSNSQFGQTAPGSPQYEWLADDLDASAASCTLVYFHDPVYSVGSQGDHPALAGIFSLLATHGADVLLTASDHNYQRWMPLNGLGSFDPAGVTQFVVGTGGHGIRPFVRTDGRLVTGIDTSPLGFGALRLELNPEGAAYRFVNTQGNALDAGSVRCSGTAADTTAPAAPQALAAVAAGSTQVDLTWQESTDNVGVVAYDVYRDGALLAAAGVQGRFSDTTAAAGTTYAYHVVARDAEGNSSAASATATATTPGGATRFSDDFETGDLSRWTTVNGVAAQGAEVFGGSFAARASSPGGVGVVGPSASKTLALAEGELYYQARFKVVAQGANSVYLMRFRTAAGAALATLFVSSTNRLGLRNDTASTQVTSAVSAARGVWHTAQVRLKVAGAASEVEVWLDGVRVGDLSASPASFGAVDIGRVEILDASTNRVWDAVVDDVLVSRTLIGDTLPPTAPTALQASAPTGQAVQLGWTASSDDIGVAGYDVLRDGVQVASVVGTAYTDTAVRPLRTYTYAVRARDAAGNLSVPSGEAVVVTPAIFADGFESADLTRWTAVAGLVTQGDAVFSGAWAARAAGAGTPASAAAQLTVPVPELYQRVRFMVESQGTTSVNLLRFRTGTSAALLTLFVSATGKLGHRNDTTGVSTTSTTSVPPNVWHELQVRLRSGAAGEVEVWLAGARIGDLSRADAFATGDIGRLEIGETSTGKTFSVAFDDVLAHDAFIADSTPPSPPGTPAVVGLGERFVELRWAASYDNIGVSSYVVHRDGAPIATLDGSTTSYRDEALQPETEYTYTVRAGDAGGNVSALSGALVVSTNAADTSPPSAPTGLAATVTAQSVALSWLEPADDVGVTGYEVFRDGISVGTPSASALVDAVRPLRSYAYAVRARDAAGNWSALSESLPVSTPALFGDGFESGDLGAWTAVAGLAAQQAEKFAGGWGARATGAGTAASAAKQLTAPLDELFYRVRFKLLSQGANSVNLLRFRSPTGSAILSVSVTSAGRLAVRNDTAGIATTSTRQVPTGVWRELQVRLRAGAGGLVEVWLGGLLVDDVSRSDSFGTAQVGRIELGETAVGRTYDVAFDDVLLHDAFIPDTTAPTAPSSVVATAVGESYVQLSWVSSLDNIGVASYELLRDGAAILTVAGDTTAYRDETLAPSTTYTYTLVARDAVGNASAASAPLVATTAGPDVVAPSGPASLTAAAVAPERVDLSWPAATDDIGVTRYVVLRDGVQLATVLAPVTNYTDVTVVPSQTYTFIVNAYDDAGNTSASPAAVATTPALELFRDGFESGGLEAWTSATLVSAQQDDVYSGLWAARAQSSGSPSFAYEQLSKTYGDLYFRLRFRLPSQGANQVTLNKVRSSTGAAIGGYFVTENGELAFRSDVAGQSVRTTIPVGAGWHELQGRFTVGSAARIATWLDGAPVTELTRALTLGNTKIGRLQIGENVPNRSFEAHFDDVVVNTQFIADRTPPLAPPNLTATVLGAHSIGLAWDEPFDDSGIASYQVFRDGASVATVSGATRTYSDDTAVTGVAHTYRVVATDPVGNTSPPSAPVTATAVDIAAPTAPPILTSTAVSSTRIDLAWVAGSDDVGVTSYTISRNGATIATVPGTQTSYSDTAVVSGRTYTYVVRAVDAAGNSSLPSDPAIATTPDDVAPTIPTSLSGTSATATRVDLSWNASTDNVGVTGYDVYRDGVKIASTATTAYADSAVSPGTTYLYTVRALDAAGNVSAPSAGLSIVAALFSDDFESGGLARWTSAVSVLVQQQVVSGGTWAARMTSSGTATFAVARLAAGQTQVTFRLQTRVIATSTIAGVVRFRTDAGAPILTLEIDNRRELRWTNHVTGANRMSKAALALGSWHDLQVSVRIAGASGSVAVTLNGVAVNQLTRTENLGTAPVRELVLGNVPTGRTYDLAFDDVVVTP